MMKVSELEVAELDCWVAKALGWKHLGAVGVNYETTSGVPWCLSGCNDWWESPEGEKLCGPCYSFPYGYSTDWQEGGPIIEREGIAVFQPDLGGGMWQASVGELWEPTLNDGEAGPTPLIAAMRAFVASRYGEEVPDGPLDELTRQAQELDMGY